MAQAIRVGIIGAGWPGVAHARGYRAAGGFTVAAAADLIPERRRQLLLDAPDAKACGDAAEIIGDKTIEAVSICLPTHQHLATALAALKAGKHVLCEAPPALESGQARKIAAAGVKAGKVLAYALQRRFGAAELAVQQAIDKGYAGQISHVRASWMRTRGIPAGTGWYTQRALSGGGALADLGLHMLDIAWSFLGQPRPQSVYAVTHSAFAAGAGAAVGGAGGKAAAASPALYDVEDSAFALLRFEGGKSMELSAAWAINQSPPQNGTVCRVYGSQGMLEVYTPAGPQLYRNIDARGQARHTPLKQPKVGGHAAMLRHFRQCILGNAAPVSGGEQGQLLMQIIESLYKSASTGKSVEIK